VLQDIQYETNKEKKKKEFEEEQVQQLYSQIVEPLEKKANKMEQEVKDLIRNNHDKIDEANRKFEKRKKDHMENYEKEFHYKSMSETDLVSKTLLKAVPFLQTRERGLNEKMNYIQQEKAGSLASLRRQVAALEKEAKRLETRMAKMV
jgi:hypothetical protein